MNRILTIFVLFIFTLSVLLPATITKALAAEVLFPDVAVEQVVARKLDRKAKILQKYLQQFDSPMQDHAQDFIDAAQKYDLDWKLLPAIAGVESTFGKHIPGGYNAYGWGVYGTQAIYFTSWTDGIFTVAKGLREGYLNKGLVDPYDINRVYAASPHWGKNVTFFMSQIEKFANEYIDEVVTEDTLTNDPKIAAISASLASQENADSRRSGLASRSEPVVR